MLTKHKRLASPKTHLTFGKAGSMLLIAFGLQACGGGGGGSGSASCPASGVTPDLPLAYSILNDGTGTPEHLVIHTDGGLVKMLFTPWGSHGEPHTGHPGGDAKSNWIGLLWHDGNASLLEELGGDGDMVCETSETCGVLVTTLDGRIPKLIAPDSSFLVREVYLDRVHTPGFYYGTLNQWRIETEMCGYVYSFGHIGWIGDAVRTAMIAQGDPDPDTYTGATGVNLLSNPLTLSRGDHVATPQISAQTSLTYPGYVVGKPWAQIEIPTIRLGTSSMEPIFGWLSAALQSELRTILQRQISEDPTDYYTGWGVTEWLYTAEADLWTDMVANRDDYSSLFTNLGAWMESGAGGDEAITIWQILKSTPLYDATLYDSPSVGYLIMRGKIGDDFYRGEVLTPSTVNPISGTLLIKWRMQYVATYGPTYQKLTYSLNTGARRLKLHWGSEHAIRANAEAEANPDDPEPLACNGSTVVCMDHRHVPGIPGY